MAEDGVMSDNLLVYCNYTGVMYDDACHIHLRVKFNTGTS